MIKHHNKQDTTLSGRLCILCREQKKVRACSEVVVATSICAGLFQLLLVDSQVPDVPEEQIITIISQQEQSLQKCVAKRCENTKKWLLQKNSTVLLRVIHTDLLTLTATRKML